MKIKIFLTTLLLIPMLLWGQCDVFITPLSAVAIDHNPGVSFSFEIQNDGITPYSGGSLYMDWTLSGFISGPIWDFNLGISSIPSGGSRYVSTPIFDIPLPANVPGNWDPYGGWTGASYISFFKLALESNGECFQWVLNSDGTWWDEPISDGCLNPNGDNFCDDGCEVELIDFNLETGELTLIPYSTYCLNIGNPNWSDQYPYDDPYIFGFMLNFYFGGISYSISIGGQNIHASGDVLILDLNTPALNTLLEDILESINSGETCELVLTIYNLNNTGQFIGNVPESQILELINLCPIMDDVIDLSLDTILYETGCDEFGAYWNPTFYITNEGDVPITEFCIVEDILGTSAGNDTVCFDAYTILPGETYEQGWPNMYEWGVLSVRVIDVNGPSGVLGDYFGFDEDIGDNMYVQIITDAPECVLGCTIVQACNYNPEATINDGSCDFESCVGCMDPEASNYDPTATINSPGLCVYDVLGCTDMAAINYNPLATIDDGSCIEPIIGCMIPEALNYDPLANTQCMPWTDCCIFPIEGCTDDDANNYDPLANIDDGSCTYDVFGCTDIDANNYNLEATEDDGSCEYDILGCTDSFASNYNPLATVDDGSCFIYLGGCTDLDALNYNPMATEDDGSCVYNSCDGEYFAPNTFTPNNDGSNDGWSIVTDSECWRDFQVLIYNRWGGLVWESNIVGEVWEGSNSNGGYYVADGIYIYTVRGVGYNQNHTFNISGYITIFR